MFRTAFRSRTARIVAGVAAMAVSAGVFAAPGASAAPKPLTLSIGYEGDPANYGYDPMRYTAGQRFFFESMYDSLFEKRPGGTAVPKLAQSFIYTPNKDLLVINLRPNVRFWDGTPVDSAAVKANLDRRDDKGLQSYGIFAKGGATEIVSVQTNGSQQVLIRFAKDQGNAHVALAGVPGMIINPKNFVSSTGTMTQPAGSGPYILQRKGTVKGTTYTLAKNTKYFNSRLYPFATVVYRAAPNAQAGANALISGQTDVAPVVDVVYDLVQARKVPMSALPGAVQYVVFFDKLGTYSRSHPAIGDVRVRQALGLAINRAVFAKTFANGARPMSSLIPPSAAAGGYSAAIDREFAYDLAKAKALMAQAGHSRGFTVGVTTNAQNQSKWAMIAKDWKELNVEVDIKLATTTAESFASTRTNAMTIAESQADDWYPAISGPMYTGFQNYQGAKNDEIAAALTAVAAATGAERKAAMVKLNEAVVRNAWAFGIYESQFHYGYNAKKVRKLTFAAGETWPLLSTIRPAK
jgi:peptide/nickel transport system substrate-binding protein